MACRKKTGVVVNNGDTFTDAGGNSKTALSVGVYIIKATDGSYHRARSCT